MQLNTEAWLVLSNNRILRYVKGTLQHGIKFVRFSSLLLSDFSDADWTGCLMIEGQ
jgi:hypothetical protein